MTKIIIEVKGGLVQNVYSTDKDVEVEILDRDNLEVCDDQDEIDYIERLEQEAESMEIVR